MPLSAYLGQTTLITMETDSLRPEVNMRLRVSTLIRRLCRRNE